ncbi:receptor-like cytoplasmic kinase 1 [Salvia splendens]|uniref:receptor-like cytoplasmic kinase 1 n=1 Tax=Salvia splendens TaxID=180675 RepID=UPI001C27FE59|nr:receptor-like cytoplasmic kinase 1 [Salvia splendens]
MGSSSNLYPALTWPQRIQIALGVARGLCYIHDEYHDRGYIHHNIRSSSVLLCDDGTAKIIDPCLWTECQPCEVISWGECHPGILPLYNHNTDVYKRLYNHNTDVYNFGEILFELLTGSKIIDYIQARQHHVASWQLDSDKVHKIVDGRLKSNYPLKSVKKMARIAQLCLLEEAYNQPTMSKVVRDLELCLGETN